MNITMKQISMMVFGSVAWLVCAVALPMHQVSGTDSLSAKVANLVIAPAFASSSDDEAKSDDDESKDSDEGKDDESDDTSSSYDFSSATLVCVSQSSVLTALNFTSSESEAKSDDDESKDDEAKSDDDESSESEATSDDGESSDDGAKSDDDESKDDEAKSDDEESDESSTELSASFIQGLPACTVFGASSAAGVWVPSSAIDLSATTSGGATTTSGSTSTTSGGTTTTSGSTSTTSGGTTTTLGGTIAPSGGTTATSGGSVSLDSSVTSAYFSELAAGGSGLTGTPSSTLESYREIRGE